MEPPETQLHILHDGGDTLFSHLSSLSLNSNETQAISSPQNLHKAHTEKKN